MAAQEQQVAGWLREMESATRQRRTASTRPVFAWIAVVAGPAAGLTVALAIGALLGVRDRLLLLTGGACAGFMCGIAVVIARALARSDGLRP